MQQAVEKGAIKDLYQGSNRVAKSGYKSQEEAEIDTFLMLSGDGRNSFGPKQISTNFAKGIGLITEEVVADGKIADAYPGVTKDGKMQFNPLWLETVGLELEKNNQGEYTSKIKSAEVNVAHSLISKAISSDNWNNKENCLVGKSILDPRYC